MAVYKYTAMDEEGKTIKGQMDTNSEADLQNRLQQDGKYLVDAIEQKEKNKKTLKNAVLSDFARQLGTLVGAGVSLVRALTIMSEEEGIKPEIKEVYLEVLKSVRRGNALSEALEEQGNTFPPLMIYMFKAAESSGNLEVTAEKMADQY